MVTKVISLPKHHNGLVATEKMLLYTLLAIIPFLIVVVIRWRSGTADVARSATHQEIRTWRVQGISSQATEHDLRRRILESAKSISTNINSTSTITDKDVLKISLATDKPGYLTATVTTRIQPVLPSFSVDKDFYGITPLYAPNDAQVDIIALSGLGGHAVGSFKSRRGWQIWLRDFLPDDVPNARVMVYGYDTTLLNSSTKSSIGELAMSFLVTLNAFRKRTTTTKRPIIFIGHSLGGLLVKEAIALAHRDHNNEGSLSLYRSTYGFAFFGVPNLGIRYEELCDVVGQRPNKWLINALVVDQDGEPSDYLAELTQKFVQTCRAQSPKFEIVSFYEKRETHTIKSVKGHLELSGPARLLVTRDSAGRIGFEDGYFRHIPLDTNHSDLVKYSHMSDPTYTIVSQWLNDHVVRASGVAQNRWTEPSGDSELPLKSDTSVLRSLAFPEMHNRRFQVEPRHRNTCEWVLKLPQFEQWKSSDRSLLWIKGKPGAGKSTVMLFLHSELSKQHSHEGPELTKINLEFFFTARGVELQHTFGGMLRSLLHQLFVQDASTKRQLRAVYQDKSQSFGDTPNSWEWQAPELESLFVKCVVAAAQRQSVMIFVDALDEAGESSARQMANFFHQLHDHATPVDAKLKICISCRHYPIVTSATGSLEVVVEQFNNRDIASFIHDTLGLSRVEFLNQTDQAAWHEVESDITTRAHGVFMWAYLVVPLVRRRIDKGESPGQVRQKLQEVPDELKDVYIHILENIIDEEDRELSFNLFQWVCLAARPLTLIEMKHALGTNGLDHSSAKRMKLRIKSLSGGLIEVVGGARGLLSNVQAGHQSVNDLMLTGGLALLASLSSNVSMVSEESTVTSNTDQSISQSHAKLYKLCLEYLCTDEFLRYRFRMDELPKPDEHLTWRYRERLNSSLPFLEYAVRHIFYHRKRAGQHSNCNLPNEIGTLERIVPQWRYFYEILRYSNNSEQMQGMQLLHIAAAWDMTELIVRIVHSGCNVDTRNDNGWTALHFATSNNHMNSADVLLKAGASLDSVDDRGRTPLVLAASTGSRPMVKRLLDHGVQNTSNKKKLGGAIYAATSGGYSELVKILIDAGADIDVEGGHYGTALQAASVQGNEEIVYLLVSAGADVNISGGLYCTALQAASVQGNKKNVQMLIKAGADVNTVGGSHGTALQAASLKGEKEIIQMLLDARADVNAVGGIHGTALQAASLEGEKEMVQMLLDAGADVNAVGGFHGTALQAASSNDNKEIVQMLLDAGADTSSDGGTAVRAASLRKYEDLMRILYEIPDSSNGVKPISDPPQDPLS